MHACALILHFSFVGVSRFSRCLDRKGTARRQSTATREMMEEDGKSAKDCKKNIRSVLRFLLSWDSCYVHVAYWIYFLRQLRSLLDMRAERRRRIRVQRLVPSSRRLRKLYLLPAAIAIYRLGFVWLSGLNSFGKIIPVGNLKKQV